MNFLLAIYWDFDPVAFYIPIIAYPILWYSLFFAFGFFIAYHIASHLLKKSALEKHVIESLTKYLFIGMLIGARLGHVFFYEWSYYSSHLLKIFFTWEGGLASHGAALGILVALCLFWYRFKEACNTMSFFHLLDILCIAVCFAAGCIRIGNAFNQEILGTFSQLPWAIYFDLHSTEPCHPVQLYEALFYFSVGGLLWWRDKNIPGITSGLFFLSVFTFRFFIDWLKLPQALDEPSYLYVGQLLSLPFIIIGLAILYKNNKSRCIDQ